VTLCVQKKVALTILVQIVNAVAPTVRTRFAYPPCVQMARARTLFVWTVNALRKRVW